MTEAGIDLVERLRTEATHTWTLISWSILKEAADEITRLRSELEGLSQSCPAATSNRPADPDSPLPSGPEGQRVAGWVTHKLALAKAAGFLRAWADDAWNDVGAAHQEGGRASKSEMTRAHDLREAVEAVDRAMASLSPAPTINRP